MANPTSYESGMHITYGVMTRCVVVTFRGKAELLGPFDDKHYAIEAAEAFCRARGWTG